MCQSPSATAPSSSKSCPSTPLSTDTAPVATPATASAASPPISTLPIIQAFRAGFERASAHHVLLELAWFVGARSGAIRGLDVRDVDTAAGTVRFVHRPETDTTLKNGRDGERLVGIPDATAAVIDEYVRGQRTEVIDDHKRRSLLTTTQGRPGKTTIRQWGYYATAPCRAVDCPHDRFRQSCGWFNRSDGAQCPSTLSPHRVRTGSITWQLNQGLSVEVVAKRVNASPEVIRKHYDVATADEEFHQRRTQSVDRLSMESDHDT